MSLLAMDDTEVRALDSKVEQMMDWAKDRQVEAEQLAQDSARLLGCVSDRMDKLRNQNFFIRCWSRFNGDAASAERANARDLIEMQKIAYRYVNMLQERQLLMAHSLLSLKNNLYSLAIKETETRELINELAKRTLQRFEKLENRVDQLEISLNLQGWLLGLGERDYEEKYPTEYMRLFRIINDFYRIKDDNWNYNDLTFMRKAIRTVKLDPKFRLSLNIFINNLIDEILNENVGFSKYSDAITEADFGEIQNYSKFAIDNLSSPVFSTIHGLHTQFIDRLDIVETLQEELNISQSEALKKLLRNSIAQMNIDLDYEFPLAETAIEILGCMRLIKKIYAQNIGQYPGINKSTKINNVEKIVPNIQIDDIDPDGEMEKEEVESHVEILPKETQEKIKEIILSSCDLPDNINIHFYIKDKSTSYFVNDWKYKFNNTSNGFIADDILLISNMPDCQIALLSDRMILKTETEDKWFFYTEILDVFVSESEFGEPIQLTIDRGNEEINIETYVPNQAYYLLRILEDILSLLKDDFEKSDEMVEYLILMNLIGHYILSKSSLYLKEYNSDGFDKKINNAIKKFKIYLNREDIIAYFDNTLFGGGDEGFILTTSGIHYRNTFSDPVSVDYKSIYKVEKTKSGFEVNGKEVSCTSGDIARGVVNALDAIIKDKKHLLE